MLVDVFEPQQMEDLLRQCLVIARMPLNTRGFADYFWYAVDNHRIQWERKHIDEILSDMDGVELQLRKWLSNGVEETGLIYEGTFEPIAGTKTACQSFRKSRDGKLLVPGHKYNTSYAGVQAWFSQLDKAGITVVNTIDYIATATTLVALYNNSQKEEHTTFKRYIKQKIYPKPHNPHVETLMGIAGGGVGEEIALALIEKYGTAYYVLSQELEGLAETIVGKKQFGINRARKLLGAIGRRV